MYLCALYKRSCARSSSNASCKVSKIKETGTAKDNTNRKHLDGLNIIYKKCCQYFTLAYRASSKHFMLPLLERLLTKLTVAYWHRI